jgi:hypothetical protein
MPKAKPPNDVDPEKSRGQADDPPPPVLGTWGRFYAVVVANTLFVYLLLVLFSRFAH